AFYARPALVEIPEQTPLVARETFAPILYVMRYRELSEAIELHNAVPQGLASSIFTTDLREAALFTAAEGSDCGIVNVNIRLRAAERWVERRHASAGARPAATRGSPPYDG